MLYGGTELGYAWYTKNHNVPEQVQLKNTLNMYGAGTNLFAGPIAMFFWLLLVVAALPYFRRHMLEAFYFTHINLFFAANIFTVFHARAQVVPYLVPAALLFYIDASIRVLAKVIHHRRHRHFPSTSSHSSAFLFLPALSHQTDIRQSSDDFRRGP